jgi:hypothetical protein
VFGASELVIVRKDFPAWEISAGQVGRVVDQLGDDVALVSFADEDGYSKIVTPIPTRWLRRGHSVSDKKKDLITNRAGFL